MNLKSRPTTAARRRRHAAAGYHRYQPADAEGLPTVEKIAPTDITTLLLGASGTGKERFARALHQSTRRANRVVAINCAAIPENLLESELFGYEKGAFTGANQQTPGKIEYADQGTLFLDEIGDLPLELQAKLLRFLQETCSRTHRRRRKFRSTSVNLRDSPEP